MSADTQSTFRLPGRLGRAFGSIKEKVSQKIAHRRTSSEQPMSQAAILAPDVLEYTNARKLFEDKKSRREQRRALRQSGDYLGVQGANPRTGYWDPSDHTSSTDASRWSDEMKIRLVHQAADMEEKKKKYQLAEAEHQIELERVQLLREQKKQEKEERKKLESKMKQRRFGKWKASENGWSSVAEPDLSPIQQSLVNSPVRETAPEDQLFPMPTANEPTPYVSTTNTKPNDYFGLRSHPNPLSQGNNLSSNVTIRRKPVSRRQKTDDTIVHSASVSVTQPEATISDPPKLAPLTADLPRQPDSASPPRMNPQEDSFLGKLDFSPFRITASPFRMSESPTRTIATSYRSQIQQSKAKIITPLRNFPPVCLKDPIAAGIPQNFPPPSTPIAPLTPRAPITPLAVWAPPTIIPTEPEPEPNRNLSFINTSTNISTTTTIGCSQKKSLSTRFDKAKNKKETSLIRHPSLYGKKSEIPLRTSSAKKKHTQDQCLPAQSDGTDEKMETCLIRHPSLYGQTNKIPSRTSSAQKRPNNLQSNASPIRPANIVTSSAHQLNQTKERTAKLCHAVSPEEGESETKSTPTSISTSQVGLMKPKIAARDAARLAYQNMRHQLALKKSRSSMTEGELTPPRLRRRRAEPFGNIRQEFKAGRGGRGDTGSLLQTTSTKKGKSEDRLVVWHPTPGAARNKSAHPTTAWQTSIYAFKFVCWYVGPVFDPRSGLRKRFEQRRSTWGDVGRGIGAAAVIILSGKVLRTVVQVLTGF